MAEENLPIEQVLRGLEISAIPSGWTAVDAVCMVKCLNPEGKPMWALRLTEGINEEELLGTLMIHTELLKRDMLADWSDED